MSGRSTRPTRTTNAAATRIQQAARGANARARPAAPRTRPRKTCTTGKHTKWVSIIQYDRGGRTAAKDVQTHCRHGPGYRKKAATRIQQVGRGTAARQVRKRATTAATRLQALARGRASRPRARAPAPAAALRRSTRARRPAN
jgi:hypothetical protein